MVGLSREKKLGVGLGVAAFLALAAWLVGQQIRSPAQIAAETAAPTASAITVPVERRVLSSEVIVRGTVRYGSPQPVVLASSDLKQSISGGGATDIVTTRPHQGARFGEGTAVMSVSGRPVFVLRGAQPSHRDLGPGAKGPDVRQLEAALTRMGFFPGPIDGRYDGQTASAVAAWYEKDGYTPFGPTDTQLEQLRTARAAAAQARDAYLQSKIAIQTAAHPVTSGEIAQARIDLETARDAVTTAVFDRRTARIKARAARELTRDSGAGALALLNEQRDNAAAASEVASKRAALGKANDDLAEAQRNLADAPPDTSPSELASLQAAVRQATDGIAAARADLDAAVAAANATRAAGRNDVTKALTDRRQAVHDADLAAADFARARRALPTARREATLAARRLRVLRTPGDSSLQRLVASSSAREAHGTAQDVARLARKSGITVPANEVLFFPTLPLRVDSVRARRGDSVTGRVMTVSNSRLAIDSDLAINDAKLVRAGAPVKIEEPDLGIKATGVVSQVADRPGTHQVSPDRVYVAVTPKTAPAQLLGTSVKLTIAVKSTKQAVLTVPVTALSVGADGSSRVQVQRPNGKTEYVTVVPGLAAKGLVEVRPVHGQLAPGDLVIVGERGSGLPAAPPAGGTSTTPPPWGGTTTPQPGAGKSKGTTAGSSPGVTPPKGSTAAGGGGGSSRGATGGSAP
jgi:hypothetical protein